MNYQDTSFGKLVKQRRREMDLTQEELARRIGCAAITLRKIETDNLTPSIQIAERLAMALTIPLDARADFIRRARVVPAEEGTAVSPQPALEEIGREDLTGRAVRGYALAERIGKGGMGSVYRAIQPNVDREVAIKIIQPEYANQPDFIRRFEAEAQLVARLEHPHIVPLYDYWREPGIAFLVMRLLRGGNLQHLIAQGPLPLETVSRLFQQICAALNASHRIGVIHRDLKPANVLLDEDGNAYLADFGIAKNISNPDMENITQINAMVGTPQYMSPEQICSLAIKPQSDIYGLGILLYEMLTGSLPFTGSTPIDLIQKHINDPLPPLLAHRHDLPTLLDQVIAQATAKDPDERYPDALSFYKEFYQAANSVLETAPLAAIYVPDSPTSEIICPFKGLRAFSETDAPNFFGRETLIQQLLGRMGETEDLHRFLAVIGPSGSGKSSVVRAGLIPALRHGGLPGSANWFIIDMIPGKHPFEELEASLLRVAVNPPAHLLSQLKDGPRGLLRAVRRILPVDENIELLLVIDQFEELFTLVEEEAERALFLENLTNAILDERSRLRVVVTLRADFTDKPLRYVDFGELLRRRFEFILPLTPDELERAIVNPAQRAGLLLDKGLVANIIQNVGDQPGTLPLLQYALSELFEQRAGRLLTNKAYQEIGGVLGALARSAETIYARLTEAEKSAAQQLFLRLVTLGEGTEDTRRRVLRAEIEALQGNQQAALQTVIEAFGNGRLLSFDRDPITHGPTLEVAHEAIIRQWGRLRDWLEDNRTLVRMQRQLATAAHEWQEAGQDVSFLLTGTKLIQYEGWTTNSHISLTRRELEFLNISIASRRQQAEDELARQQRELDALRKLAETEASRAELQTHSAQRLRRSALFLAGALILALIAASIAGIVGNRNSKLAIQNEAIAATAQAAEALAIQERDLSTSRELAAAAVNNLAIDPERSLLLALHGISTQYSTEAENALRSGMATSHALQTIITEDSILTWDISPDNQHIAIYQTEQNPQVRDIRTGQILFRLDTSDMSGVIRYTPDGSQLVTYEINGQFKHWDAANGKLLSTLSLTEAGFTSVMFNLDVTQMIVINSTTATVWNIETGQRLFQLAGHEDVISAAAFSRDGHRLATVSMDGIVKIWDARTGENQLSFVADAQGCAYFIEFENDPNHLILSSSCGFMAFWDIAMAEPEETRRETLSFGGGLVYATLTPDGSRVAFSGTFHHILVWDTSTHEEIISLPSGDIGLYGSSFSPDGRLFAALTEDGILKIWDLALPYEKQMLTGSAGLRLSRLAYSPDGQWLAILSVGEISEIQIYDTVSFQLMRTIREYQICCSLAFSPDGKHLLAASQGGVKIWPTTSDAPFTELSGHEGSVVRLAFNREGTLLATAGQDSTVKIWAFPEGKLLRTLIMGETTLAYDLKFSPDGRTLATARVTPAQGNGVIALWDVATGNLLFSLGEGLGEGLTVWALDFSPDGTQLAGGYSDNNARIWDISEMKPQSQPAFTLRGHSSVIWTIAYSPDGMRLATASFDHTTKLWAVAPGKNQGNLLTTIPGHTAEVSDIIFSPDGKFLATASWDGTTRISFIQLEDLITAARERITRSLTPEECQLYLHTESCPALP